MKKNFNIETLRQSSTTDPLLGKLILLHIICYIGLLLIGTILSLLKIIDSPNQLLSYFLLENTKVSTRPWTLFTYILGIGNLPLQFLRDMMLLHFIGRASFPLFKRHLTLLLYGLSTLLTGLIFWLGISYLPLFRGETLKLSAVSPVYCAMLGAVLAYNFHHKVPLFIFEFKLKFLGLFLLLNTLFIIPSVINNKEKLHEINTTLEVSNLVGALIGLVYGLCVKKLPYFQKKLNVLPNQAITSDAMPPPPMSQSGPSLTNVDDILEKISRTGYESLTHEERKRLFDAGK
ncbi:MAG: rhomboid family intramembrane serine protease [Bacteroidota bacterium]